MEGERIHRKRKEGQRDGKRRMDKDGWMREDEERGMESNGITDR